MRVREKSWTGFWWLPELPERRIHGTAHLGATQTLDIGSQLEPPVPPTPGSTIVVDSSLFESRHYPVVFCFESWTNAPRGSFGGRSSLTRTSTSHLW